MAEIQTQITSKKEWEVGNIYLREERSHSYHETLLETEFKSGF